ncbi:MAG: hypothetical protein HZB18_10900 [Chloroflexi bacterium]|nr:hypothetical protein [Chloroflexota bacterium]
MSTKSIYRLGGILGIVVVVATFALYFTTDPSGNRSLMTHVLSWIIGLGSILLFYAAYLRCRESAPLFSLLALIAGIGGNALFLFGTFSPSFYGIGDFGETLVLVVACPLFGIVYFQTQGISRILAVIGILTGAAGFANSLVIKMDGGSWSAPNDPANLPAIMGTYLAFVLGYVIWLGWTSRILLKEGKS